MIRSGVTCQAQKNDGSCRRRKCDDGSHSATSHAYETDGGEDEQGSQRPPGVKASKSCGKKAKVEEKEVPVFQSMWSVKKEDLVIKERLSKMRLLDSLIAKQEPLPEYEETET